MATEEPIEYALLVDFEDGNAPEFVPAQSASHAAEMARRLYAGRPSWTVGRERQPWRFVARDQGDRLTNVTVSVED